VRNDPEAAQAVFLAATTRLAAAATPDGVVVTDLETDALHCELVVDPAVTGLEMAFAGAERLLVLLRYAGYALLHLVDVDGPRKVAEARFEAALRVLAARGERVLLGGTAGVTAVTRRDDTLEVTQLPMRAEPHRATWIDDDRFLVNAGGQFEEWGLASRAPLRRFRLERPTTTRQLGASAGFIWWVPSTDPTVLEAMPPAGRGQVKRVVLPEPCAAAVGARDVPLLVALGATTKTLVSVDLESGNEVTPVDEPCAEAIAWVTDAPPTIVTMARGEPPRRHLVSWRRRGRGVGVAEHADAHGPAADAVTTAHAPPAAGDGVPAAEVAADAEPSVTQRLLAWRDRMRAAARPAWSPAVAEESQATTWRDELVAWGRVVAAGTHRDPPPWPPLSPLAGLARLDLPEPLLPALALAYTAYLTGRRGIARADVAHVLGRRWDEALGRGLLARSGALRWRGELIRLAPAVAAFLDERGPVTGTVIGDRAKGRVPIDASAVIAPSVPLKAVAERCAPVAGPILVVRARAAATAILLEARLREVVPLFDRCVPAETADHAGLLVRVDDRSAAAALALPVLELPAP
jgi:hypothetical protein